LIICTDISERKSGEAAVQREQELLRQLLELHERDRKLLAFELHDGFAQQLTGAMLNLEAAAQLQGADPELARQSFQTGIRLLRESIDESRRLVSGLRPPVLDEFGIVPAIEHLIDESRGRGGPEIRFVSRGPFRRLARPLESAVFRIVQETLGNARRHSQSRRVEVELSRQGEHVCVSVRDWGVGFDPAQIDESHFGLRGIRERARLLGGEAAIDTAPGKGTWVRVRLPVVERAPAKPAQAAPAARPGKHRAEIIPEPEG
jgi:signal transduction histidine kinase